MACGNEGRFWADTLISVIAEVLSSVYIRGILPLPLMLYRHCAQARGIKAARPCHIFHLPSVHDLHAIPTTDINLCQSPIRGKKKHSRIDKQFCINACVLFDFLFLKPMGRAD